VVIVPTLASGSILSPASKKPDIAARAGFRHWPAAVVDPGRVKTEGTEIDKSAARLGRGLEWLCGNGSGVLLPKAGQALASFIINSLPIMLRSRLNL
jgi:hypothetical protein